MTKNDIYRYLDKKYNEAQAAENLRFLDEVKTYTDKRDAGINLSIVVTTIKQNINSALNAHDAWAKQVVAKNPDLRLYEGRWGTVPYALSTLTSSSDAVEIALRQFFEDTSAEYTGIQKKHNETTGAIRRNYNNVRENVKKIKSMRDVITYLVGMGFKPDELNALEDITTCVSLMAPVDTKYLF